MAWDWLTNLFGSGSSLGDISGAASNVAASTPSDVTQAAWAMNPALSGIPETSQSLAATTGSSGIGGDKLAKALSDLGKSGTKLGSSDSSGSSGQSQISSSSRAVTPQSQGLGSLVAALIKRREPFFQLLGQPVEQGQTNRGLLGL
jgi:hypothetical protein